MIVRAHTDDRSQDGGDAAAGTDRLEAGFERRVSEFAAAARRARSGSDPDAIHDLRVGARRLVATLRVWRGLVPSRARRAATRALRRLRRRVGRAREIEVHVGLLEERLPRRGAGAGPAAGSVLERLHERLARRRRSAARRVSSRPLKRVLGRLETAGAGLRASRLDDRGAIGDALAVERGLGGAATAALRSASEHPDDASLHEARVLVKKWRYTLEVLEETLPGTATQTVRSLRRIQGVLGEAHDRALLRGLLERHTRKLDPSGAGEEVPLLMGRLDHERERAVRRFQRLAATLLAQEREAAPEAAALGGPGTRETSGGIRPATEPREVPQSVVAGSVDRSANVNEATSGRDAGRPPRDERWERMATWLERSGRRS